MVHETAAGDEPRAGEHAEESAVGAGHCLRRGQVHGLRGIERQLVRIQRGDQLERRGGGGAHGSNADVVRHVSHEPEPRGGPCVPPRRAIKMGLLPFATLSPGRRSAPP